VNFGKLIPPIEEDRIDETIGFWEEVFGASYREFRSVLRGEEREAHRDVIYLQREGDRVAGTAHLTVSVALPSLGGLGEVAVRDVFRGRGIASSLCGQARDEFAAGGGRALFLATANPAARRVYERLGWQAVTNSNVMVWLAEGGSPEASLAGFFEGEGRCRVAEGTAADRIAMIPLILAPQKGYSLDANANLFSRSQVLQPSCMGLYPRYARLRAGGQGTWFSAYEDRGRLVGLSTVRLDEEQRAHVDGFAHPTFMGCWEALLRAAIDWGVGRRAATCLAKVADADEEKRTHFERLGFRRVEPPEGLGFVELRWPR
jgi:GNAT superfamily N-acetyltransferase